MRILEYATTHTHTHTRTPTLTYKTNKISGTQSYEHANSHTLTLRQKNTHACVHCAHVIIKNIDNKRFMRK